jgi:hypothetical protein
MDERAENHSAKGSSAGTDHAFMIFAEAEAIPDQSDVFSNLRGALWSLDGTDLSGKAARPAVGCPCQPSKWERWRADRSSFSFVLFR